MPKISRKQVLRDFRTRSLLEATRRVITKQGFNAVTMERVARDAGITRGGIYLYFSQRGSDDSRGHRANGGGNSSLDRTQKGTRALVSEVLKMGTIYFLPGLICVGGFFWVRLRPAPRPQVGWVGAVQGWWMARSFC